MPKHGIGNQLAAGAVAAAMFIFVGTVGVGAVEGTVQPQAESAVAEAAVRGVAGFTARLRNVMDWQASKVRVLQIVNVIKDSPAYTAGLRKGDSIVAIDDRVIANSGVPELCALAALPVGEHTVAVLRPGDVEKIKCRFVAAADESPGFAKACEKRMKSCGHVGLLLDIDVQATNMGMSMVGNVVTNSVFKVVEVMPKSPADLAGIQAGDNVTAINGAPNGLMTPEDSYKKLSGVPGTSVKLTVQRGRQKLEVPLVRSANAFDNWVFDL